MKKVITLSLVIVAVIGITIYAQNSASSSIEEKQLKEWEQLAEKGDTAAMHRLIEFYDENSPVFVEVEEVIEADGTEWSDAEVDSLNNENKRNTELAKKYSDRLEFWLNKGIATDDPVALFTKGMRLYYKHETEAIEYLSKAADGGNAQAALFCGSACFNQGQIGTALKYLQTAYENEIPSAGWHLAMCLATSSQALDNDSIINCLRHSANLNYPEAVSEMRRIEPNNPVWQHKADSLDISFPDFPITVQ